MTAQHVSSAAERDPHPTATRPLGRPMGEVIFRALRAGDLPAIAAHLLPQLEQ